MGNHLFTDARSSLTLALSLCLACVGLSCTSGPTPRKPASGAPRAQAAPDDAPQTLGEKLGRQLEARQFYGCIAVADATASEGKERSEFGVFVTRAVEDQLLSKARGVRFHRLSPKALTDHRKFVDEIVLAKADAVLQGEYFQGQQAVNVTLTISRPLGETLASAQGSLALTPDLLALLNKKLESPQGSGPPDPALKKAQIISSLYTLKSTDPEIKVSVSFAQSNPRVNEPVSFIVTTSVDGHLSLWNNSASGGLAFLVPNQFVQSVPVKAGQPYMVPSREMGFEVVATPPAGWDRVKAIVSRQPIPWLRDPHGNVPTGSIPALEAIAKLLENTPFGEARCEIEIKP